MKAAIYNPYLDTLGGGEKYTIFFAKALAELGYQVDVYWKSEEIKTKLENRFGVDLRNMSFVNSIKRGDGYDICFWVSDGSIPLLRARKNYLHFQIPFKNVNGRSLINKMKLFRMNKIICNSYFTKKFIDKEYGVNSTVIYPPVDVENFRPKRKENFILSVARFSQLKQAKNQDVLIDIFKKIYKRGYRDWKLILAGGVEIGVGSYLESLRKMIKGFPIEIVESPQVAELRSLYGRSKIFWSAAGFGIDEGRNPEMLEHFGISLVEAMSAGSVPVAYNGGGHREIISHGENGFLWSKINEIINFTSKLMDDNKLLREVATEASYTSKVFEYDRFVAEIEQIL